MSILIRSAAMSDAIQMSDLLNQIIKKGGTTAHRDYFDQERMSEHYISPPLGISCVVALSGADILGFQQLEWPAPNSNKKNPLPEDWASIATFVAEKAQGKGVGHRLFRQTYASAKACHAVAIDATIRKENHGGLTFYDSLGFCTYRTDDVAVSKKILVE